MGKRYNQRENTYILGRMHGAVRGEVTQRLQQVAKEVGRTYEGVANQYYKLKKQREDLEGRVERLEQAVSECVATLRAIENKHAKKGLWERLFG